MAYVFAMTMAFAGAPAPLLVVYQQHEALDTVAITVIFAVFPVGVAAALFLAGHLSDRVGRARVLAPAIALNLLAGLIFTNSSQFGVLVLARVLSGLGVGLLTATATAYMSDLAAIGHGPGSARTNRRAEVTSTAVNLGGIGSGMLLSGMLADLAPEPMRTPYVVLLFALVPGLLLLSFVPETIRPDPARWRYRPQRIVVPTESRRAYAGALIAGFVGFAMFGVYSSLSGTLLARDLGIASRAAAGAVAFLAFAAAAACQIAIRTWSLPAQRRIGCGLLAAGLLLLAGSMFAAAPWAFILGGILTGAGTGALFTSGVSTVVGIAPGNARAEALAGLFLASYIGMSAPIVALGALMQALPASTAVLAFGTTMLALVVISSVLQRGRTAQARSTE